jgi:hypothetical protein
MAYATSQGTSPSIGLLTYGTHDTIASDIWFAVSDVARERGSNAFCFPGGSPSDQSTSVATSEVVFDLVDSENLVGLIIWIGLVIWKGALGIPVVVKQKSMGCE